MSWLPAGFQARLDNISPQTTDSVLLKIIAETLVYISVEITEIRKVIGQDQEQKQDKIGCPDFEKKTTPSQICAECNFPVAGYHNYNCSWFMTMTQGPLIQNK